jgi:hypothetical protein
VSEAEIKRIMEEVATIQAYLTAAQGVLDSGYMPDITALESRVAQLCERIQKAPKEIHDQCLEKLVELLEQLNACEQKMRAFHATRTTPESQS